MLPEILTGTLDHIVGQVRYLRSEHCWRRTFSPSLSRGPSESSLTARLFICLCTVFLLSLVKLDMITRTIQVLEQRVSHTEDRIANVVKDQEEMRGLDALADENNIYDGGM